MRRIPAPHGEEPDGAVGKSDLRPDQAMGPRRIDGEGVPQERRAALRVRAPEEDHPAPGPGREVQLPAPGKRAPGRRGLQADPPAAPVRHQVPRRARAGAGQGLVPEARPHLRLPAPAEVLQRASEPGLARGREDGHHPERQAEPGVPAQRVGELT